MAAPFKAYDIRGIVGDDLTIERAYLIGRALAQEVFAAVPEAEAPKAEAPEAEAPEAEAGTGNAASSASTCPVVVGRDMRLHSPPISQALTRGLSEGGCAVLDIGLCATPMNYWANVHFQARGSVMVTASHNGPRYNGFKVSGADATPIDYSSGLDRVEACVRAWEADGSPAALAIAPVEEQAEVLDAYLRWMDGFLVREGRPVRIGVDASNGMAGLFLTGWFTSRLWLEPQPLFWEMDGLFPNHEADPLKAENLRDVQSLVEREGCDFGACFDGDADRCMFVDEAGTLISSDLITALIAQQVLAEAPVDAPGGPILYDLRSSRVVAEWIEQSGGTPIRERVGHSFMKRKLRALGARFGGELSGHYYFADCFDTDSGLMALVQIVNILQKHQQPLSELIAPLRKYSATGEINFRVPETQSVLSHIASSFRARGARLDDLDGLSVLFEDWWFNLRSSNTEPLLRLNLEAPNPDARDARLEEVQALIQSQGGVLDDCCAERTRE
jgi:phosphomannomutase